NRPRREPGPGAPALRFVAVALIAAEADEQLAPVRGVAGRRVRSLRSFRTWGGRRLLAGASSERTRRSGHSHGDSPCADHGGGPGEREGEQDLILHRALTAAA